MKKEIADRILALQERAMSDPEYIRLCQECPTVDAGLLRILHNLPPEQQDSLLDYIGFYWDLYWAMLRIACTESENVILR